MRGGFLDFFTVWLAFTILHFFFSSSFNPNFLNNVDTFVYLTLVNFVYSMILCSYVRLSKR